MRSFIAIELPDHIGQCLTDLVSKLREPGDGVKWVRPENIHLTLRFLGEIEPTQANVLGEYLTKECAAIPPFRLKIRGVGAFPNLRRASVLWVGLESFGDELATVQSISEMAAQSIGLPTETRPFTPHLTLGRIRGSQPQAGTVDRLRDASDFEGDDFLVQTVALFRSELTPKGPVYTRLKECSLKNVAL